jgi:hypothetical protein
MVNFTPKLQQTSTERQMTVESYEKTDMIILEEI